MAGVGGRLSGEDPSPSAVASDPPAAVTTPSPPTPAPIVTLSEPAPPPAAVTGIPLWIRGQAPTTTREVVLVLRTDDVEVARQSTRPTRSGRFAGVFTLQPPRPAMEITVTATALGDDATLGEAERVVLVEPLQHVAALPAPRPRFGEDGVLGSRGVDLAALVSSRPPGRLGRRLGVATDWPWPRPGSLAAQTYR